MKIKKLINLRKQSNTIDDPTKLSLGSLYFVGTPFGVYDGSEIIIMPVSTGLSVVSFYCITAYEHHTVKSSNNGVVISPFKTRGLLDKIAKIFGAKINRKTADILFNAFAERLSSSENIITLKIGGSNIEFIDHVATLSNNEICKLKLHLIKRIIDIRKWPGLAIKKWAIYHLRVNDNSMRYIYESSLQYNRKSLVNALQEHHTYNASKNKYKIDVADEPLKLKTADTREIDETIATIKYNYFYNEPTSDYIERSELPHVEEEDDIRF